MFSREYPAKFSKKPVYLCNIGAKMDFLRISEGESVPASGWCKKEKSGRNFISGARKFKSSRLYIT